jgi:hypothetical protein
MTPSTTTAAHQATGSKERRHLHPASSDTGAKLDARGGGVALDIFGWCCVVLSAHILVDAFVDLRPGTSPTDHLISGTVPVAVLATLALAYRRLRTGIGATIAVLLGLAAAGAGAANVAAVVLDEFTVGRLTGLAAGGAGVVLVTFGTATLLRARRPGGSRLWRWTRRAAETLLVLALVMLTSVPMVFGYISANWSVGYALDESSRSSTKLCSVEPAQRRSERIESAIELSRG